MLTLTVFAQDNLALSVIVEDMTEPFPATAKAQVENKLNRLLTLNGIASSSYLGQFFLTASVVPLTKDILPGPPTQIAATMEFTFYIADYYNQLVFSTTSLTAKGVGTTEAKSYIDAIKHVNLNSPELKRFVAQGKTKIIEYYNTEAPKIMAKAKAAAQKKDYEQALFLASTIPSECTYFQDALDLGNEVYQQYIDFNCQINLQAAKMAWIAGPNVYGAEAAGEYLSKIYPEASCYQEAEALYQEIKAKVLDDWQFEMRKYADGIDLEKAKIEAWRAIGTAYGENQQPTTTNIGFLR